MQQFISTFKKYAATRAAPIAAGVAGVAGLGAILGILSKREARKEIERVTGEDVPKDILDEKSWAIRHPGLSGAATLGIWPAVRSEEEKEKLLARKFKNMSKDEREALWDLARTRAAQAERLYRLAGATAFGATTVSEINKLSK